jgi:hypothetical protein
MTAFVVKTYTMENYASHCDDWDGTTFRWKNKPGSNYIVEAADLVSVREVIDLICKESDTYIEKVDSVKMVESSEHETDYVKKQREYDPDGWDTLYLDPVIRRGKNSHWYMKRGNIVGQCVKHDSDKYAHLAGKFYGWVDNLNTGKCVLKIEGDKRIEVEEAA